MSHISQNEKRYRLNTKGLFLTYPQCPAPRECVQQMIESKGNLTIEKGLVAQELHMDGEKHLHAYIKLANYVNTTNCHYFDLQWEGKNYHGKYEPAKSAHASIKYMTKHDKDPLEIADMDWK